MSNKNIKSSGLNPIKWLTQLDITGKFIVTLLIGMSLLAIVSQNSWFC